MLLKFKTLSLLTCLFLLLISNLFLPTVWAQTIDELEKKRQEIQRQIAEVQKQLEEAQGREQTLKSQLNQIDSQTRLTNLKVEETTTEIARLEQEIVELSGKIIRLSTTVDTISEILLTRIIQTYKYSNFSTLDLIFSSQGVSDLLARMKYMQVAQANDKKILYQLQATKATYNDQKSDKEVRQIQQEKLRKDLERYEAQLTEQKKAKEDLLRVTQNDEIRYQQEIARLKADIVAILNALSNVGNKIADVKKGDVIAYQSNTGCVSPPPPGGHHLHLEVYINAKVIGSKVVSKDTEEPIQFKMSSHLVNPKPYLDKGQWRKPLDIYPGGITAEFGASGENYIKGFPPHTGLDIAGPLGSPIYAVDDGIAYAVSGSVCDVQMGYRPGTTTPAKGRIVDHQNGIVTLYWHVL